MDISNYKSILGQKIKYLRLSEKMTQEEFCNRIELENSNLSNIENGKTLPSLQTIIKIITVFRVEPNSFFNFIEWKPEAESTLMIEIIEYLRLLPDDLKKSFLEILKNIK